MAKSGRVFLVDVGSASVGVAIAELNTAGVPVLSQVKRVQFENASGKNTEALPALAISALKKCLEGVLATSPAPKTAHVVLAAPWYRATISVINSSSEKPARLTESAVQKALAAYD